MVVPNEMPRPERVIVDLPLGAEMVDHHVDYDDEAGEIVARVRYEYPGRKVAKLVDVLIHESVQVGHVRIELTFDDDVPWSRVQRELEKRNIAMNAPQVDPETRLAFWTLSSTRAAP